MTLEFPDDTPMGWRFQDDLRMLGNIDEFTTRFKRDDTFEVMYAVNQSRVRRERDLREAWEYGEAVRGLS
jgi:hypothetical protein